MLGVVKELYRTGRGKEYELALVRPWRHETDALAWHCWISATPLPRLSQDQDVRICIRLPFLLLAQLGKSEAEEFPEELTRLSVNLVLEKQIVTSGEVKLLFTGEGLMLESLGKTERNEMWVSWSGDIHFSRMLPHMVDQLEKALSDARAQSKRIGFH